MTHSAFEKKNFLKKFFFEIFKNFFFVISRQIMPRKGDFQKLKKKFFKKKFFFCHDFFFKSPNKIVKNLQIKKMLTVPNRQDFEVFITYCFFEIWASATIVN